MPEPAAAPFLGVRTWRWIGAWPLLGAAILTGFGNGCASGHVDAAHPPVVPAVVSSPVTRLVLERSGGSNYRFRVTLQSDGKALWEGLEQQIRGGAHRGSIDPAIFQKLAAEALANAVEWERIAPSLQDRFGFHGDYAQLRVHREDGSSTEIGPTIMGTDVSFDPLIRYIEGLAEVIYWTPLDTATAKPQSDPVPVHVTPPLTTARLDSGKLLTLAGDFQQVENLWPDTALVYRREYAIWSLDGGARTPRLVHEFPRPEWHRMSAPTWSQDEATYFVWLHQTEQLVGIDARTGHKQSLLVLPTHSGIEFRPHPDPHAVWRRQGVVEDAPNGRLLQLVQEESNDDVAFWQRSPERKGGHRLLSIPIDGGVAIPLTGEEQLPGEVFYWDLALNRGELYTVVRRDDLTSLEVRSLEGDHLRSIELPFRWVGGIVLSPDERWLLIERRYRPGREVESQSLDGLSREGLAQRIADSNGGFVLYDIQRQTFREGPDGGHQCAWSPDSEQVAVLDSWTLSLFDLRSGTSRVIAAQEPDEPGNVSPGYWERPVWSRDGRRLAVRLAHDPTLLLDFHRREFMLYDVYVEDATWSPVPVPFASGR